MSSVQIDEIYYRLNTQIDMAFEGFPAAMERAHAVVRALEVGHAADEIGARLKQFDAVLDASEEPLSPDRKKIAKRIFEAAKAKAGVQVR